MYSFGIHAKSFNKEILKEMRERMEADKALLEQSKAVSAL